jgi:hypothetical protein
MMAPRRALSVPTAARRDGRHPFLSTGLAIAAM